MADAASASLTAQDTWTDPITVSDSFDLSITGTFNGTVTVQRKRPNEAASAYRDIETFTSATQKYGKVAGHWHIRAGFKTGEFTSGTAVISLSK